MPVINFHHTIDVDIERFLDACSLSQLYEVEILLAKKLSKIEQEMEIQDLDKASMKHKILVKPYPKPDEE